MLHGTTIQNSRVIPNVRRAEVSSQPLSENEILALVKKGDTQAYQQIVKKYMQTAY